MLESCRDSRHYSRLTSGVLFKIPFAPLPNTAFDMPTCTTITLVKAEKITIIITLTEKVRPLVDGKRT